MVGLIGGTQIINTGSSFSDRMSSPKIGLTCDYFLDTTSKIARLLIVWTKKLILEIPMLFEHNRHISHIFQKYLS